MQTQTMGNLPISAEAPLNCSLCPRLVAFRTSNQKAHPDWFNGAVPSFGLSTARLLIVGLAPGLKGANRTGRPFTGDYAGDLLYTSLLKFGFAHGTYEASTQDTLELCDCMITNAVRCVPPENKPTQNEIKTCRPFLKERFKALPQLKAVLALGRVAHEQILASLMIKISQHPFAHGAMHHLQANLRLFDSYHCSRYNTNTGRLTPQMFEQILGAIIAYLKVS